MDYLIVVPAEEEYELDEVVQSLHSDGFPVERMDDALEDVRDMPHTEYDVSVRLTPEEARLHYSEKPGSEDATFLAAVDHYFTDLFEYGASSISFDRVIEEAFGEESDQYIQDVVLDRDADYSDEGVISDPGY